MTDDMTKQLTEAIPGVDFNFSQYIEDNVEEAASGVKGENSIKIFGNDLETLQKTADDIKERDGNHTGRHRFVGLRLARSADRARSTSTASAPPATGLATGDINATVQAAIGGQAAGNRVRDGQRPQLPDDGAAGARIPQQHRCDKTHQHRRAKSERQRWHRADSAVRRGQGDPGIGRILHLPRRAGTLHAAQVQRARTRPRLAQCWKRSSKVAEQVKLPGGYRLEWVGEFGNLQEALARLAIAVPFSILLICILLYMNFGSVTDMLLSASVIPMALIGGIFALYLTGTPFSVSAAIGFVALFGIAAMDGIIVLSYYNQHIENGMDRASAVIRTCKVQMRPVMMTCIVACVGLLPAAFSTGIGSQVQKPLALVVVGGIILAPMLILIVLPVLISLFSRRVPPIEEETRKVLQQTRESWLPPTT